MFHTSQLKGLMLSLAIALPAYFLGQAFPIIGGPVFAIILGMILGNFKTWDPSFQPGLQFAAKKLLQYAVILLGFGLNLHVVFQTGKESLPIILATISTALILAYLLAKLLKIDPRIATLVGVGSSICGGSAIAATAPVIDAKEEEVAQAISVIFFFNLLAALLFPILGQKLGFDTHSGQAFGIFAGTAINDTSSVTAAAATWDNLFNLGNQTLDKAVTVKLTRTLAIIPITLGLGWYHNRQQTAQSTQQSLIHKLKNALPLFIVFFILASLITTLCIQAGIDPQVFAPFSAISKFFIIMAMAAIGINTDLAKLIKTGSKALILGAICWIGIILVSLSLQAKQKLW